MTEWKRDKKVNCFNSQRNFSYAHSKEFDLKNKLRTKMSFALLFTKSSLVTVTEVKRERKSEEIGYCSSSDMKW